MTDTGAPDGYPSSVRRKSAFPDFLDREDPVPASSIAPTENANAGLIQAPIIDPRPKAKLLLPPMQKIDAEPEDETASTGGQDETPSQRIRSGSAEPDPAMPWASGPQAGESAPSRGQPASEAFPSPDGPPPPMLSDMAGHEIQRGQEPDPRTPPANRCRFC